MELLVVALKMLFAGLLAYGLMRVVLRRIDMANADRAQQVRIARGVGLAAAAAVIVVQLI